MDEETTETTVEESGEVVEQEESLDFNSDQEVFKDLGIDPSKYGLNEAEESDENQENTEGEALQETSILDTINAFNMTHGDSTIKIESEDQLKELVQKGYDYTLKTQNLSEERKGWDLERSQAETELNAAIETFNQTQESYSQQLNELQQWQHTFERLKSEAPDVFEEVQNAYNHTANQFRNPILEQQMKAMQSQFQEALKGVKAQESKAIVDEFEREKQGMASTEKALNDLGIKLDWDKVKAEWRDSGLPLKKAIGAIYFEDIAKAQASKAKVATVQAKTSVKTNGAGSSPRPGKIVKEVKNTGDYFQMAQEIFNNMR